VFHLKSLQLELTSRCNERCIHCYIPQGSKTASLDTAFVCDILSQYRDMGGQNLTISGGEPMCHPDFFSIVDNASFYGFPIRILSPCVTALTPVRHR
jgi:MoaA/NifB/PqqE/SkfB family radical SAM enzyme